MSIVIERIMACDHCGENWCADDRGAHNNNAALRRSRQRSGWVYRKGKDYCEVCAAQKVWLNESPEKKEHP